MTNKFLKFLSLSALLVSTSVWFSSCDKDDDDNKQKTVSSTKKVFILNEGSYMGNNSTLDVYYPNGENAYQSKVYANTNLEVIGDTGQDIVYYGGRIYLSVFGSNYLAKLDLTGKVLEKYSFSESEGQPRYLAVKDGFVYVSLYSGQIAKFDTTSIATITTTVDIQGSHLEKIYINGDKLYAAIAGDYNVAYDNRIAVVDLTNFSFNQHITIGEDPTYVLANGNNIYAIHYNTTTWIQELIDFNISSKTSNVYENIAKINISDNILYYIKSETEYSSDYSSPTTNTSFYKSNIGDTVEQSEFLDLSNSSELSSSIIYMFEIDPDNGDFYIGTTDYNTNGTIYRFDKNGKFIEKFETSGINPNKAIFVY